MNISPTPAAISVMARLRPPSSRHLRLVYGFSTEVYTNLGFTFQLESGEAPVSPGSGTISGVVKHYAKFKHTRGLLTGTPTFELTITHGQGIQSTVAGLATLAVQPGDAVGRGDVLGQAATDEVFFAVRYNGEVFSPHELSRHWQLQGEYVLGQSGNLRFAPDKLIRDLSGGNESTLFNGVRYFSSAKPLLVNVDFNGNGTKTGLGATGLSSTDYWNSFVSGAFSWVNNVNVCLAACGQTKVFNRSPQTFLRDSTGTLSAVWLERVAAASSAAGSLSAWDAMLSTWIGGWSGAVPEHNFFSIRGLSEGTYRLFLYASTFGRSPATDTTFGAGVDNDLPDFKNTTATLLTSFVENRNYVKYDLVLPVGSHISVEAYGYFDGLQLKRLS
jgi:hypothetical protein